MQQPKSDLLLPYSRCAALRRRDLMLASVGGLLGATPGLSLAQTASDFPNKPIRIILSNAAGTAPDVVARALGQRYQDLMGKPVVVDNRPGAGGVIAAEAVAGAAADGHTLLFGTMAEIALTPHLYKSLRYDVQRDFTPVAEVGAADLLLVVNPAIAPSKTLEEYLAWARTKQPLLIGTFGVGTPHHLAAMQLGDAAQMKVEPVHFRAPADALSSINSGDIQASFMSTALASSFIKSGKLKAMAVTALSRSAVLPDVPTAREVGLAAMEAHLWMGMFAPSKTPREILDKLSDATIEALRPPEVRKRLEDVGFRVTGTTRPQFTAMLEADLPRWGAAVRKYGMQAN